MRKKFVFLLLVTQAFFASIAFGQTGDPNLSPAQITTLQMIENERRISNENRLSNIAEQIKHLRRLHDLMGRKQNPQPAHFAWDIRRLMRDIRTPFAFNLQKLITGPKTSTNRTSLDRTETTDETPLQLFDSIKKRLSNVISNPLFQANGETSTELVANASQDIDALIEITTPGNRALGPLVFYDLIAVVGDPYLKETDRNQAAIELLRRNCNVDFINDGTNYRALRTIGISENVIAEIDKCRSPEQNAIIVNRRAAEPREKLKAEEMSVMHDVIRVVSQSKDLAGRKRFIDVAREFLLRWESDEDAREMNEWLKQRIPIVEQQIKTLETVKR
jgi:hypothetical protein